LKTIKKHNSTNPIIMVVIGAVVVVTILTVASFVYLFIITLGSQESEFNGFVEKSIVNNAEPEIFWVHNQTKANQLFNDGLVNIRNVVQANGYSSVSTFAKCGIVTNPRRYSTLLSRQHCSSKLCNTNGSCIYLFAYSGGNRRMSIRSLTLFYSNDSASAEIADLSTK